MWSITHYASIKMRKGIVSITHISEPMTAILLKTGVTLLLSNMCWKRLTHTEGIYTEGTTGNNGLGQIFKVTCLLNILRWIFHLTICCSNRVKAHEGKITNQNRWSTCDIFIGRPIYYCPLNWFIRSRVRIEDIQFTYHRWRPDPSIWPDTLKVSKVA